MVFQPIRCTAHDVATTTGKLLPHLFTLIPINRDGYFLLHYYTLADIFPLGSMVLFVARTFLPFFDYAKEERWNSLLHCKVNNLLQNRALTKIIVIFVAGNDLSEVGSWQEENGLGRN
jgi:hypothetical protein